jgi:dTDP-4-amino-4,6-dideoxygalactose transaminase/lipid II:glycine glycyltransferase (peptidoglycan interpeptide bridge formation enzyme)
LGLLFTPWRWKRGPQVEALRSALKTHLQADAFLFSSGREGLLAFLRAAGIGEGHEVIVQGYTCVVVPNAIRAAGAKTVYVDIDQETLNLNLEAVEAAITPKTKAIICQHTFGLPADIRALRTLCDTRGLLLIEDCAHVLPDASGPAYLAQLGDAVLLSFGRDKAISGIAGGAMLCRKPEISRLLAEEERSARDLGLVTIKRLLLYPLLYGVSRPLYGLGLGKVLLKLCQLLGLFVPITSESEKQGKMSGALRKIPNACAALALDQFSRLAEINAHRRRFVSIYLEEAKRLGWTEREGMVPTSIDAHLPLQKFPIFVPDAGNIRSALRKKNIHLEDGWTGCVVCPPSVSFPETGYVAGSDPEAEAACQHILSLPTHPGMTEKQARELVGIIDEQIRDSIALPSVEYRVSNSESRSSLSITEATDPEAWDSFLKSTPFSPFLQSWAMGEVYRDINQEPIRLVAEDERGIQGICQAIVVPARRGRHLMVQYGPITDGSEALSALLAALREKAAAHSCSFIRISPFWREEESLGKDLRDAGAIASPLHLLSEYTWYIPLTSDDRWSEVPRAKGQGPRKEEEILSDMRKTTRNLIRRAEKEGVIVEASKDPERDLEIYFELQEETYKRHHFVPYRASFIRAQVKHFAPKREAIVYIARYQEEPVAASVHMSFGGVTSYHHGASTHKHAKIPASYLLQWTAIKEALARGDEIYNFWGIAPRKINEAGDEVIINPKHPFAGVTTFKTGFGGKPLPLIHCADIPLSKTYWLTRGFEQVRKWKRGF